MQSGTVERNVWINAPRAKVWSAITDPVEIAQWFIPTVPGAEISRSEAGTLMMRIGEMGIDFALLDIVEDGRCATLLTLPDRRLPVTYTLEDDDGGTRLTVRVSGFDTLHDDEAATRQRITGIVTRATGQILFVDTPGYQTTHRSSLNQAMNRRIGRAHV